MFKLSTKGFTIIEALVAITVLLIGIIAVTAFFPMSLKIISDSEATTTATNMALAKIEEIQAMPYETITVGNFESKHHLSINTSDYLYNFQRETTINYLDSNLNDGLNDIGLKKISVTVYWISNIGKNEKSLTINTIRSTY